MFPAALVNIVENNVMYQKELFHPLHHTLAQVEVVSRQLSINISSHILLRACDM